MNEAARLQLDVDRKTVATMGEGSLFCSLKQKLMIEVSSLKACKLATDQGGSSTAICKVLPIS